MKNKGLMRYYIIARKGVITATPYIELDKRNWDVEMGDIAAKDIDPVGDIEDEYEYDELASKYIKDIEAQAKLSSGYTRGDYVYYIREDDVTLSDMKIEVGRSN